jgi:DNA polymerase III delta subunit
MNYRDFIDKKPALPTLVIIEGTERLFVESALSTIIDRVLEGGDRSLNCDTIDALEPAAIGRVEAAAAAFAFLAPARVVVVKSVHAINAESRRAFWKMAQTIPGGNVVVIEDLLPPTSKRPEPLSRLAGRSGSTFGAKNALVIDTTLSTSGRRQFIEETMAGLKMRAAEAVVEALADTDRDLFSIRADLQKMSLYDRPITVEDIAAECLDTTQSKTFEFAGMLIEGRKSDALMLADDLLSDDRGAAIPMLYSLADDYVTIWEMTRAGGTVAPKQRWRESRLRPYAQAIGERRAKTGVDRAIKGFEAIVTGKYDDAATVITLCIDAHPLTK